MKEMDSITGLRELTSRLNESRENDRPSIHLAISPSISRFSGYNNSLTELIEKFLKHVQRTSHPTSSIRVSVHEKIGIEDLESFFETSPSYWFHLSVRSQALERLDKSAQEMLEEAGYHHIEWIEVEGVDSQLGVFCYGGEEKLALFLFMQNRGARRRCDFLVPVTESA